LDPYLDLAGPETSKCAGTTINYDYNLWIVPMIIWINKEDIIKILFCIIIFSNYFEMN